MTVQSETARSAICIPVLNRCNLIELLLELYLYPNMSCTLFIPYHVLLLARCALHSIVSMGCVKVHCII